MTDPRTTALSLTLLSALLAAGAAVAEGQVPKDPKSPLPGISDGRGPAGPVELKITSPKADQVLPLPPAEGSVVPKGAEVPVRVEVKGYELFQDETTKTGQYVQIVLDGRVQVAHYAADKAWVFRNVPKGTHTLRAFFKRPWNESVRDAAGYATVTFHVGEKDGANATDPALPVLTLTQPRGKIRKELAARVLLDFWVAGCTVAPEKTDGGCQVRYRLDNEPEQTMTALGPVWFEKLPPGRHSVTVALTKDLKVIPGRQALYQGFFDVEGDKPAEGAPVPAAAAAPAAPGGPAAVATPAPLQQGPGGGV
jgi:hypothetical protein